MYICQLADQIVPQLRNLLDIYDHEIAVEGFQILADCPLHLEPQQKGREKWLALWHISIQPAASFNIEFTD
jgi:hypothetical protein